MYGAVAGAGAAAGLPVALAFTGVSGRWLAGLVAGSVAAIVAGVAMLRVSYRGR